MPTPDRILLYDGVCGLCNRTVRRLIRADRDNVLTFAPLQGETAAQLRELHDNIPSDIDTVVFIEGGKAYLRSRAFIRIARHLRYPAKALSWLWIVPWPLSDLGYRLVAKNRYRVWGRSETCEIPAPEVRERFLA